MGRLRGKLPQLFRRSAMAPVAVGAPPQTPAGISIRKEAQVSWLWTGFASA